MPEVLVPVYDAHDAVWLWWLFPFLPFCGAILAARHLKKKYKEMRAASSDGEEVVRSTHLLGLLSVMLYATILGAWQNGFYKLQTLESGKFSHFEGQITAVVEDGWKGHASILCSVQNHRFHYFDFDAVSDDNNRIIDPGCLKEGLPARVAYTGRLVLRMEIKLPRELAHKACRAQESPTVYEP